MSVLWKQGMYRKKSKNALVVKHPDFYYDFTANGDRDMLDFAEFCRFRPFCQKRKATIYRAKYGNTEQIREVKTYDKSNVRLLRQESRSFRPILRSFGIIPNNAAR